MNQLKKPFVARFVLIPLLDDLETALEVKGIATDENFVREHTPSGTKLQYLEGMGIGVEFKHFTSDFASWPEPSLSLLSDVSTISLKVPQENLSHRLPPGDYDFEFEGRTVRVCSSLRRSDVFVSSFCYRDIFEFLRRVECGHLRRLENVSQEFEQTAASLKCAQYEVEEFSSQLRHIGVMFYRLTRKRPSVTLSVLSWVVRYVLRTYFKIEVVADKQHAGAAKIVDLDEETSKVYNRN